LGGVITTAPGWEQRVRSED